MCIEVKSECEGVKQDGNNSEKRKAPEEKKERFVRTVVGTVCLCEWLK